MNTALKMKLEEMNRRLNEALDTDLFEESESEFNEFQAEVDSFERELEEISEFRQDHLQLSELKKIGAIQKKIRQVKNGYNFYDPEYERSVMFPNGEDGEEKLKESILLDTAMTWVADHAKFVEAETEK